MPLPAPNSAWPPKQFVPAFDSMREWDLWYRGDANDLEAHYRANDPHVTGPRNRPSQFEGGVVGRIARYFWGRPVPDAQTRTKVHVPVAADLATMSADLLFSEPPRIILPDGFSEVQTARVSTIFESPEVQAEFIEGAELGSALSGVYLRAVWDKDIAPHPLADVVPPDQAIPTWKFGRLAAVTFWTVLEENQGDKWVRHLERHEPGAIIHGLFEGTQDNLGKPLDLASRDETSWAAVSGGVVTTGISELTAVYIPNIRPQRLWREAPDLYPMGRSDFTALPTVFDSIDEVMSSWIRDVRLGKGRVFIPESYLETGQDGQGLTFDPDQELYAKMNMLGKGDDGGAITPHQFQIRWEEHSKTIQHLMRVAARSAGLSPGSWGDDGQTSGTQTATGVKADTALTDRTRDKKVMYWRAGLAPFVRMMMNLDNAIFGGGAALGDELPSIEFATNPNQDPVEMANTVQMLRTADAASTETLVRMVNPDWDDTAVDTEVRKIMDEKKSSTTVVDPGSFRGAGEFGQQQDTDEDEPTGDEEQGTTDGDQPE